MLPGLDDGPAKLEESLEMAAVYAAAGISKVAMTPHDAGYLDYICHLLYVVILLPCPADSSAFKLIYARQCDDLAHRYQNLGEILYLIKGKFSFM